MKNPIVSIGVSVLVVAVVAAGALTFSMMQHSPVSAAQLLIEGASKRAKLMNREEIDRINSEYHLNLVQRLDEAKKSGSAKILSTSDLSEWGWVAKKDAAIIKTYLGYVDAAGHKIIIGLDDQGQPLFVYDVDAAAQARQSAQDAASKASGSPAGAPATPNVDFQTLPQAPDASH